VKTSVAAPVDRDLFQVFRTSPTITAVIIGKKTGTAQITPKPVNLFYHCFSPYLNNSTKNISCQ
jgi:hypothetical protein